MNPIEHFGETQDVAITILVDNRADLIVRSTETIKYFTDTPLLAEHGFAALVHLKAEGVRLLWDAGVTRIALMENLRRMKLDPATITHVALSHGHFDHTASLTDVLQAMELRAKPKRWEATATPEELRRYAEGRRVPVVAHPAAFRERWNVAQDGSRVGPSLPPPRAEWEAAGADIILSEGPCALAPGCWATGAVPRASFETVGLSKTARYRDGDTLAPDAVEEDQAIVLNVKDKGLVVLSGCAHSGIVNTVNYAREISGVERVWAVLGGFHLARAKDDDLRRTVDALRAWQPKLLVPSHCTGFHATCHLAAQMAEVFAPNVVGATYLF